MLCMDAREKVGDQRDGGELIKREKPGPEPVIDVMGVIGDVVGDGGDLSFGAGKTPKFQVLTSEFVRSAIRPDRMRQPASKVGSDRSAVAKGQWPVVLDQSFERLPAQIQPVECGIAPLERSHHPQGLGVVIEPSAGSEAAIEGPLAGMPERGVPQVMGQGQGLGKILIEPEGPRQRTGDLGDLQSMGQAGAKMIALVKDEDLGLVGKPPERGRMDDSVAVPAKGVARRAHRLRMEPAATPRRYAGIGRACDWSLNCHPEAPH